MPAASDFGEFGAYSVCLWGTFCGATFKIGSEDCLIDSVDYSIMGMANVDIQRMICLFDKKSVYPGAVFAKYGAGTIEDFCSILIEEAATEGVRPEVVFAQAMLETGWLKYGGQVTPEQCNFCGLGAVDGGASGASFNSNGSDSVRVGLRAQVQHLKAYACTDELIKPCVDPRFRYVQRGCAPTLSGLSGRWASDLSYGTKISGIIAELYER